MIPAGSPTYADRAKGPNKPSQSAPQHPSDARPSSSSPPSVVHPTPKQPVPNVWTLRAARRAAPPPPRVPPLNTARIPKQPDWPTVALANGNGKVSTKLNGVVSRPTTPPPPSPKKIDVPIPISPPVQFTPMATAWDVPPSSPIPPNQTTTSSSASSYPSASVSASASAPSSPPTSSIPPSAPTTSSSTSAKDSAGSSPAKPRPHAHRTKWVPIPPEELRAAAEQQQQHRYRPNGPFPRRQDGWGHGYREGNGYARDAYRGSAAGKSQSASQSRSGATSRAESDASQHPFHDPQQTQSQSHEDRLLGDDPPQPPHSSQSHYPPPPPPPSQWPAYLPPPPHGPHQQQLYAPPPPAHYYGPGPAPYGAVYEPAPYPLYWNAPPPGANEEGGGGIKDGWWIPPPVPPLVQQMSTQAQGGGGGWVHGEEHEREQVQQPVQQERPRPPPPSESGAVSLASGVRMGITGSSSLGSLGSGSAGGSGGGVVFGFGSVDSGLAALTLASGVEAEGEGAELNVDADARELVPSKTTGALASSSSPPPTLPASISAPAREPGAAWRQQPVVWPAEADPWAGGGHGSAEPFGSTRSPLFAIGVSPRTRVLHLPGEEVIDLTVALPLAPPNSAAHSAFPVGEEGGVKWEFGTTVAAAERGGYGYSGYGGYAAAASGGPGAGAYPYAVHPVYAPNYAHGYAPGYEVPPYGYAPPPMMGAGYGMPHSGPPPMGMYGLPIPPAPSHQPSPPVMPNVNGGGADGNVEANPSVNGSAVAVEGPIASVSSRHGNENGLSNDGSEWEVKDYGYRHTVLGLPYSRRPPDDGPVPYVPRAPRSPEYVRDSDFPTGRPRRGSYNGGGGGYEPRGGWRRGRGGFRGSWRGGYNNRGGFQSARGGGVVSPHVQQQQQQQPPPFNLTPPPQFTPLVPEGYHPTPSAPYLPAGYEYQPQQQPPHHHGMAPVPMLRTRLSFPIDHLRQEILGQLEFYLSPDNMATDLFLRQQMDSRGWVRIDVLASFKRVQAKTTDVNLVKDVLALSEYAEIRGEWVRSTEGWEKFVLPDAKPSVVEAEAESLLMQAEAEDVDEEEDVVFVMGREAQARAWAPERLR